MAGWTPCCRETGLGRAWGCGAGLGTGMVERQLSHHRDQLAGRGGRQRRAGRAGVLTSFRRDRGQGLVGGGWGPFGLRLRCRAVTPVCGRAMGGPRGRGGHPGRHPRCGQYRCPVPPAAAEPADGDTAQLLVGASERRGARVLPCGRGASGLPVSAGHRKRFGLSCWVRAAWLRACATMLLTLDSCRVLRAGRAGQGARSARMAVPEAPLRRLPGSKIIGAAGEGAIPGVQEPGGGWRVSFLSGVAGRGGGGWRSGAARLT